MRKCINLTGQRFGRLTVLERNGSNDCKKSLWLCKCDCGKEITVVGNNLKSGITKSCGCLATTQRRERLLKHGFHGTRLYNIWRAMKQRCYNKKSSKYPIYGARGITICDEWLGDFQNFYNWAMDNGYKECLSIDRIDVNGNYEPSNCRWATVIEQGNNRRTNHIIAYQGKTQNLTQWCEELGVKKNSFYHLLKRGYGDIEALEHLVLIKNTDSTEQASGTSPNSSVGLDEGTR